MVQVADRIAAVFADALGDELPVGLRAWDGSHAGPQDGPQVVLRSRAALRRLLYSPGELGLARAYVCGDIDVEGDVTEGLRRCWAHARGRGRVRLSPGQWLTGVRSVVALGAIGLPPKPPAEEARPKGRLHSLLRDRAVIAHHYDRSNAFYQLVLDEHMAYSCGYWTDEHPTGRTRGHGDGYTLADAQRDKLELICAKLRLREGMSLLDVGCGWGALLLYAAEHHGVRATGVTLSQQQAEFVHDRAKERHLDHLVDVRLMDYRELRITDAASFDAVSSIEMGEHVGEQNYPRYTEIMATVLRPGGRLLLQQMSRGSYAPGGGAFIESYIAPDMTMRPLSGTLAHLERAGFEIEGVQAMREHYVRTVRAWSETLEERWDEVVALTGERYARIWRLYLAGGALAFEQGRMGVDQILAIRPSPDQAVPA